MIPKGGQGRQIKYPFGEINVGEFRDIDSEGNFNKIIAAAVGYGRYNGKHFVSRRCIPGLPEGYIRIYRDK
jgi:hypothetical protein